MQMNGNDDDDDGRVVGDDDDEIERVPMTMTLVAPGDPTCAWCRLAKEPDPRLR